MLKEAALNLTAGFRCSMDEGGSMRCLLGDFGNDNVTSAVLKNR